MAFLALIAKPTPAATFSSRTKAPTVELSDLASFAAQARSNKWFSRSSNESGVADVFIKTRTILTAALFMATGLATADQTNTTTAIRLHLLTSNIPSHKPSE